MFVKNCFHHFLITTHIVDCVIIVMEALSWLMHVENYLLCSSVSIQLVFTHFSIPTYSTNPASVGTYDNKSSCSSTKTQPHPDFLH